MTVIESTADTVKIQVEANEPIDTYKLTEKNGTRFGRNGFPVSTSAGEIEVSNGGVTFVAISTGADDTFVIGQTWKFARVTENAEVLFYLP